jgi:hypothetical protein
MQWLALAAIVTVAVALLRSQRAQQAERWQATVTHVEQEPVRLRAPHLKNRYVVRVTYRRDDGEEDSFVFDPTDHALRTSLLPRIAVGDRLEKVPGSARPLRVPELTISAHVDTPIDWRGTGEPDRPYVAELDGESLAVEVNHERGGFAYFVFADERIEGGIHDWPEPWTREGPEV